MIRFLFILFFGICVGVNAQSGFFSSKEVKVLIENGDTKQSEGDYLGAIHFYELAYGIDSLAEGLTYRLALSNKGYHNYKKAKTYLKTISESEQLRKDFPDYLFHQAEILKREGDYKQSHQLFKRFLKEYPIKNDLLYKKAKNEVKNHSKVLFILKDTIKVDIKNIGDSVNTGNAEFNSFYLNDSIIVYTSLSSDSILETGEVFKKKDYNLSLRKAEQLDSVWIRAKEIIEVEGVSIDNGSFDQESKKLYFSRKVNGVFHIYCSKLDIEKMKFLKEENIPLGALEFSNKNPHYIREGNKEYLVFSSKRTGGKGGWDLWYSELKRGKWSNPKNLGNKVNTLGDEVSPFYNATNKTLYFSSNWHPNIGGFDLFQSYGSWKRPNRVKNIGIPFNSNENDLYITYKDSLSGMLTSSRAGSFTDLETVCCNDLYEFQFPIKKKDTIEVPYDIATMERLKRLIEEYHVTLYFHNDRPNPDNWDTITPYTYIETYESYIKRIPTYRSEYSKKLKGIDSLAAVEEIQDFFDDYVHRGVSDLKVFTGELIKELNAGNKIELSVKGYASPLAKSDYNVNLTLRRINSLENYLRRYPDNLFSKYLDNNAANGGFLKIVKVPFGEYRSDTTISDDFYDTRNSVYSKGAALERKIEIINLQLINDSVRKEVPFQINLDSSVVIYDLGKLDTNVFSWRFHLINNTDSIIKIDSISTGCKCLTPKRTGWEIDSKEVEPLDLDFNMEGYEGPIGRKVKIRLDSGEIKELRILFEL